MSHDARAREDGDGSLFPSGPWRGFYLYRDSRSRHRMDLRLDFSAGRLQGDGIDDVGAFSLQGRYDQDSLEVTWTKTYHGGHDVFYRGFREGRGIWGTWTIPSTWTGGFQIWPGMSGEEEALEAEKATVIPVPALPMPKGGSQ